jgi:UDP-N-acetylglucosamine enolpyruvyl transferase
MCRSSALHVACWARASRASAPRGSPCDGPRLGGGEFRFAEDFHEIATFLALGAITGGEVEVKNSAPEQFPLIDRTFAKFGVEIVHEGRLVAAPHARRAARARAVHPQHPAPRSRPRPGPTCRSTCCRSSSRWACKAEGSMMFWNKVYDGALGWTSELSKFGAHAVLCPTRTASSPSAASRWCRRRSRARTSSASPSRCSWWRPASRAAA